MGTLLELHEPRAPDAVMNLPRYPRGDFVISTHGDEGWQLDRWQLIRDVPILDRSDDREFVRPVHRVVDRLADVIEAVDDLARPHGEAAHVPSVELRYRREVPRVLVVSHGLVFRDRRADLRRQSANKPSHLPDGQGDTGESSGDDKALQTPLVFQRGRNGQCASIARAHEVDFAEAQRGPD